MKKLLAVLLSVCFLMACAIPAFAADYDSSSDWAYSDNNDPSNRNFIRPILPSDFKRFGNKMKELYTSFDITPRTLKTSWDLAYFDSACSGRKIAGPIGVVPVKLNGEDFTLMILGGTAFVKGQATGVAEDTLSAFEKQNDYLTNIVKVFNSKDENGNPVVPKDKPVIVSGISLGGMVAQQLLSREDIMSNFDLRYIICFGSPLLAPEFRTENTTVVRFCDTMDIVPYLGRPEMSQFMFKAFFAMNIPVNGEWGKNIITNDPTSLIAKLDRQEMILKEGNYKSPISAHTLSYVDGDCWTGYDVLGVYGGSNEIEMLSEVQFFADPSIQK